MAEKFLAATKKHTDLSQSRISGRKKKGEKEPSHPAGDIFIAFSVGEPEF